MIKLPEESSRKYTFAWACLLIVTVALAFGRLSAEHFVEGLGLIILAYMGGNVGEHFAKRPDRRWWRDRDFDRRPDRFPADDCDPGRNNPGFNDRG